MVHLMSDVPPLVGTTVDAGRLLISGILGSGGFGTVFRAIDVSSPADQPREYALKCIRRTAQNRSLFLQEAHQHKRVCDHPNVLTFHRFVEEPELPFVFFVFDLIHGHDLHDILSGMSPSPFYRNDGLVRQAFTQLLDAVKHCHELGVYHRDLKPDNVLCSADLSQIFLADFGLATTNRATAEFRLGSKFYMSPECLHKDLILSVYSSPSHDVWQLGLILTNMITGTAPWHSPCKTDPWFSAHAADPRYLIKILGLSEEVGALLSRVFTLDPYQRIGLDNFRTQFLAIETFFSDGEGTTTWTGNPTRVFDSRPTLVCSDGDRPEFAHADDDTSHDITVHSSILSATGISSASSSITPESPGIITPAARSGMPSVDVVCDQASLLASSFRSLSVRPKGDHSVFRSVVECTSTRLGIFSYQD